MNSIIINKDSIDKDCADLRCYYVVLDGVVIAPVTMAGKTVEEVEAKKAVKIVDENKNWFPDVLAEAPYGRSEGLDDVTD